MYLVTGCSEPIIRWWIHTKKKKSGTKFKYRKYIFFLTSRNGLPSSRPVYGVKKTSSPLGKRVDLAGQVAMLLTVGRSYVGNDATHSTLLDRACSACSYENLPKYRSYRVSNTAPWTAALYVRCGAGPVLTTPWSARRARRSGSGSCGEL